ncbi:MULTISPECIES: YopX family protein [Bacillus]|uniref:YopX family protein n=1 Tax=Bacillus TaxID=1386 RepID=UPI0023E09928|nr:MULTISPECIES: YopX family protein [Bacillus]MDY7904165.1 YopX family protein [Bacillus sp. AG1]WES02266.1 YopX family protein [Bacillus velezensis]
MREIKFRMYSKKKKVMHYWDRIKQGQLVALDDNDENEKYSSWMQYTGLKDANDREIYEGDILKRTVTVVLIDSGKPPKDVVEYMKVEYREDYAGFFIGERPLFAYVDNTHDVDTGCRCTKAEIAGNIYEDTELLEKVK